MNTELKRVGLLGGTFDPVHNGHLNLAVETAQIFNLQKVFFIPVSRSPHKLDCRLTSSSHRIAMLKLALQHEATFSIDPLEIKKGGVSYTIDTLSCLKKQHPGWELFLILGADAFLLMDTWKSSTEILKLCHILVGTRPGVKLEISTELGRVLGINTKHYRYVWSINVPVDYPDTSTRFRKSNGKVYRYRGFTNTPLTGTDSNNIFYARYRLIWQTSCSLIRCSS